MKRWILTRKKLAKLQKQVAAKSAELLQFPANSSELTNQRSRMTSQNAAGATVLDDLKLVHGISDVITNVRG